MRRIAFTTAPILATLILAGCATAPPPVPQPQVASPVVRPPPERSGLVGLSASDLVERFGQPALQVREGASLKLQFRGQACILDAYLYPAADGRGAARVTHVDTRLSSGADTDQTACIAALTGA